MKKIIRLTESDLHNIIAKSVKRILKEDVLGNNWHEIDNDDSLNNYEQFENQENDDIEHNWSGQGEENIDPTRYNLNNDVLGWNDDEPEGSNHI